MRARTVQKRNAFTLIELLVVIAIIVLLMALTVGILSRVWAFMDETKTVTEINKLSESCTMFKSTFGRYPPAKILLCEQGNRYAFYINSGTPAQAKLATYSVEYLSSIFPGINLGSGLFDWNGDGNVVGDWVLEGEESLVYFLGGVRQGGAPLGFNTDKSNPLFVTPGARLGPFFQFDEARIDFANSPNSALSGGRFAVYKDYYGTPYAYFYARTPGMNNYYHPGAPNMVNPSNFTPFNPADQYLLSDCHQLCKSKDVNTDRSLIPFWQNVALSPQGPVGVVYFKPDSFQIISAGKDKLFGCGGQYNASNPEASPFDFMNSSPFNPIPNVASVEEKKATFDNLSNVTSGRVVPQ